MDKRTARTFVEGDGVVEVADGLAPDEMPERWGAFFGDLEGQFDADLQRETDAEIVDRIRHEIGQLTLVARLRASQGLLIRLGLRGRGVLAGAVGEVGPDWISVIGGVDEVLVAVGAIVWAEGLRNTGRSADGPAWATPDLRRVVREWAQARTVVAVEFVAGPAAQGTFVGVFADHVDLACHPPEVVPRPDAVTSFRSIPFSAVATIRRLG